MPLLDVSFVLDDPLFADTIDIDRKTVTIGQNGRSQVTVQTFADVSAVVTQGTGDTLKLLPEGASVNGTIMVHTRFDLRTAADGVEPDEVVYPAGSGKRHIVTITSDYSRYGAGFVKAVCTIKPLAP